MKDQFIQFVVRQFLDVQADQLVALHREMTSLSLADERCSLMTRKVQVLTETLLEDQIWRCEYTLYPSIVPRHSLFRECVI